jgi:predicted O-methyltransferase YrrM
MSTHSQTYLHPLQSPESSVRPADGTQSYKLARPDIRRIELDSFVADHMADELEAQKAIVPNSSRGGLPEINVSPYEGHVLSLLLRMMNAKRGVEIGTLGGYSTSWICRALEKVPGAKLDTLELSPKFAAVAEKNLAPWKNLVEIHVGPAIETLEGKLASLNNLDFVFIDADKINYPNYFEWAWSRIRPGGVVFIDNFYLWGGVYFRGEKFPADYAASMPGEMLVEVKWAALKTLWKRVENLGAAAQKTILSTSEGLGIVMKVSG